MKKFNKILALTAMLFISISCSSDSDPQQVGCETAILCQNGGTLVDCECECPQGYSGTDCSSQISPEAILVTNIRVSFFPNQTPSLSNWDASGLPDIYVEFDRADGNGSIYNLYTADIYYEDAISNGTLAYDFKPTSPIRIDKMFMGHVLTLVDYDGADAFPSSDDTIGILAFYPYSSTNGFPSTLVVKDDSLPLRFELSLEYQW